MCTAAPISSSEVQFTLAQVFLIFYQLIEQQQRKSTFFSRACTVRQSQSVHCR